MAGKQQYVIGTEIQLTASFTVEGVPTDPSTITCKVKNPKAIEKIYTNPDVVRDSVGNYHCDIYLDTVGLWFYRWEGTGAATVAAENSFQVAQTHF